MPNFFENLAIRASVLVEPPLQGPRRDIEGPGGSSQRNPADREALDQPGFQFTNEFRASGKLFERGFNLGFHGRSH